METLGEMEHGLYQYSVSPRRAAKSWPGDRPVACWVTLQLETWELEGHPLHRRDPEVHGRWGTYAPDTRTFSYRMYGDRVGFFRVVQALDDYSMPITVAMNAARPHARLLDELAVRDCEFAAAGTHATRIHGSHLNPELEMEMILESREAITEVTGEAPKGWIGPDRSESVRTLDLLKSAGFEWVSDWPNDDRPYFFSNGLVSLPAQPEIEDIRFLWVRGKPTWEYPSLVQQFLETLALSPGSLLNIVIRPWLLGQPHRIRYLREVLTALASDDRVWCAKGGEIASYFVERERPQ